MQVAKISEILKRLELRRQLESIHLLDISYTFLQANVCILKCWNLFLFLKKYSVA